MNTNEPEYNAFDHGEGPQESVIEFEAPPNEFREAALDVMDRFLDKTFAFIKNFRGNQIFALDCALLAMGKYHLVGCDEAKILADKHGETKQHVTKMVKHFQESLEIGPMPGQRRIEACQTFSKVRKSQLKK